MNRNDNDDYHEYDEPLDPGMGGDGTPGYRGPRTRRTHGSHHRHFCSRDWPQLEWQKSMASYEFSYLKVTRNELDL